MIFSRESFFTLSQTNMALIMKVMDGG